MKVPLAGRCLVRYKVTNRRADSATALVSSGAVADVELTHHQRV